MLVKVNNVLIDEKARLGEIFNKVSISSSFNIEEKIKEFSNVLSTHNISKLLEQDFSDIEKMIDEKLSALTSKNTEELLELLAILQKAIPKADLLKDFNVIEPLDQQILKFHERSTTQNIPEDLTQILIQDVELQIAEDSGVLKIQASDKPQSFTFDKAHLEQIKSLHFDISMNSVRDFKINEKTLPSISLLLKFLTNVKSVNIHLESNSYEGQKDQLLGQLLSNIFSQLQTLEEIDINIKNTFIEGQSLIFFIERLLPRYKTLKSFSCHFNHSNKTNRTLRILSNANLSNYPHLEKLHLTFEESSLCEEDFIQFFSQISHVKDLQIRFANTSLTDQALEYFSMKILPSLDQLESLDLRLSKNKITDISVQKLLANIPNSITNLNIRLNQNNITDAGIQDFIDNKLALLTNLKDLLIGVSKTNVSDTLIKTFEQLVQNKNSE